MPAGRGGALGWPSPRHLPCRPIPRGPGCTMPTSSLATSRGRGDIKGLPARRCRPDRYKVVLRGGCIDPFAFCFSPRLGREAGYVRRTTVSARPAWARPSPAQRGLTPWGRMGNNERALHLQAGAPFPPRAAHFPCLPALPSASRLRFHRARPSHSESPPLLFYPIVRAQVQNLRQGREKCKKLNKSCLGLPPVLVISTPCKKFFSKIPMCL